MYADVENKIQVMLDVLPDVIIFKDGHGRWLQANEFSLTLFGLLGVDYRGKKDSELGKYSPFFQDVLNYCEATDEDTWRQGVLVHVEERVPQPDGSERVFDVFKVPIFNDDGSRNGIVIIGRDITERLESEEKYRMIANHMTDLITIFDDHGKISYLSPSHQTLLGVTPEIGNEHLFLQLIVPEDRVEVEAWFKNMLQHTTLTETHVFRCLDTSGRVHMLESQVVPVRDLDGSIQHLVFVTRDITEKLATEELLRKSAMLNAVGEMAAGIAHEIRNPLASIKGFLQFTHGQLSESYYEIVMSELNRIEEIISQMLMLSRPQSMKYQTADVATLLSFILQVLEGEFLLKGISYEFLNHADQLSVFCEPNHMKQVFINLIKNAADAMPNGGQLTITLHEDANHQAVLTFVDEGVGIDADRLQRLGEPFYTTKEKGNGLGLMMCFKIVEQHKGNLQIFSEPNQGTQVVLTLPTSVSN